MKFEDFNLKQEILKAIKHLGYDEATAIQQRCIPEIKHGKDVVGQSSTGSGKTAAFGLPILEKIEHGKGLQALILTPTRELCVQVTDALNSFGKFLHVRATAVFGGVGIGPQFDAIKRVEIVVGTPGRILDHIERKSINFSNVRFLVLDEADKMFEMGFIEDVERIISFVPRQRQTLLFSATLSTNVHNLVRKHLHEPVTIKTQTHVDRNLLKQVYYVVKTHEKFSLLYHFLKLHPNGLSMIFCATRSEVDVVAKNLKTQGIHAMAIHGGLSQNKRLYAIESLRKEHVNTLVCTDVAARGLDIQNITHIYNYDVPKTSDDYIHRIGRTARAGSKGDAITLLSERDYDNFNRVLSDSSLQIRKENPPQFERVHFNREQDHRRRFKPDHFGNRGAEHSEYGKNARGGERRERSSYQGERSGWGVKASGQGRGSRGSSYRSERQHGRSNSDNRRDGSRSHGSEGGQNRGEGRKSFHRENRRD